jgi:hypothetical protein
MKSATLQTDAGRRTEAIRLVVTASERVAIAERARLAGKSVGGFLRELGLQAAAPPAVSHSAVVGVLQVLERYDDAITRLTELEGLGSDAEAKRLKIIGEAEEHQRRIEDLVFRR